MNGKRQPEKAQPVPADRTFELRLGDGNNPKLMASLSALVAAWLCVTVLHVFSIGGYWLTVLVLAAGFIPAFARLLKPRDLQNDTEAYRSFMRMTVTQMVLVVAFLILSLSPNALSGAGMITRLTRCIVLLPALMGLPLMAYELVLLFRYRSRRSVSGLAIAFSYVLLGVLGIGLLLPVLLPDVLEDRAVLPFAAFLPLLALFLSFRNSWIVNLRKDRKWRLLGMSVVGMITSGSMMALMEQGSIHSALRWISPGILAFGFGIGASMIICQLFIFFGTLFALPTAGMIDRRNVEVASLRTLTRLLTGSFETQQLIDTSLSIACDAIGAPAAWMEIESEDNRRTLFGTTPRLPAEQAVLLMSTPAEARAPLSVAVRQHRRIEVIENVPALPVPGKDIVPRPLRSIAAVPLSSGKTLLGVLYVAKEESDGFDREDVKTLQAIAGQIAVALEHSQLVKAMIEREKLQQDMVLAQTIQQRLLPASLPVSPVFELYAESQAASAIGGDYYDVTSFSDQTLGVIVADVAGKGVGAALFMGVVKGVVQALSGTCADPKELLSKINSTLYGSVDKRWFVTMSCAQILEQDRTLRIARAGHCPTIILRNGKASFSRPRGMGIGIAQPNLFDKALEMESVEFGPGDSAVFISDGLPEATSPAGDEFGYDRLLLAAECLKSTERTVARDLRNEIFGAISTFACGELSGDDITMLIIRWKGQAGEGKGEGRGERGEVGETEGRMGNGILRIPILGAGRATPSGSETISRT